MVGDWIYCCFRGRGRVVELVLPQTATIAVEVAVLAVRTAPVELAEAALRQALVRAAARVVVVQMVALMLQVLAAVQRRLPAVTTA
jgi:hypothetical protein